MRLNKFTVFIYCILMFSGCREEKVERYPLDSIFNRAELISNDSIIKINICKYVPSDWDSMFIVKPYVNLSRQNALQELKNFSSIKSEIEDIEFSDMICYLLFVKNEEVIGYGSVKRSPIDFASFPPEGKGIAAIRRDDCNNLFLEKGTIKLSTIQ